MNEQELRLSLKKNPEEEKSDILKQQMQQTDVSQYSPAVMQNKALLMLIETESDGLYDVSQDQIPYIAYLRAIDSKLPIPGTMRFIQAQLSLSRSRDRKGRLEFGQAINKQSVITPAYMMPGMYPGGFPSQENKPSLLSRLLPKKKEGDKNV